MNHMLYLGADPYRSGVRSRTFENFERACINLGNRGKKHSIYGFMKTAHMMGESVRCLIWKIVYHHMECSLLVIFMEKSLNVVRSKTIVSSDIYIKAPGDFLEI